MKKFISSLCGLLLFCSTALADTERWVGAAQDITQVDKITFAGTWVAGETVTFTVGNISITVTGGNADDTVEEYASACAEALQLTREEIEQLEDNEYSVSSSAKDYGEFQDFTVEANGAVITIRGITPGFPFTISVSETSTSGTISHNTGGAGSSIACTGKHFFNNDDNWEDGSVPTTGDILLFDRGDTSIYFALDNAIDQFHFQRKTTYRGNIGLLYYNNWNGKSYVEYRTDSLLLEPDAAGTVSVDVESSSGYTRLDFGTNAAGAINLNVKSSPGRSNNISGVHIDGGQNINLITHSGSVSLGEDTSEDATNIATIENLGNTNIIVGENCTFDNAGDTVITQGGSILFEVDPSVASGELKIYDGIVTTPSDSGFTSSIYMYGGKINFRSSGFTALVVYGGTFDCSENSNSIATSNEVQIFGSAVFIDPRNALEGETLSFIGVSPEEVQLKLKKNISFVLGTPGSISVE